MNGFTAVLEEARKAAQQQEQHYQAVKGERLEHLQALAQQVDLMMDARRCGHNGMQRTDIPEGYQKAFQWSRANRVSTTYTLKRIKYGSIQGFYANGCWWVHKNHADSYLQSSKLRTPGRFK